MKRPASVLTCTAFLSRPMPRTFMELLPWLIVPFAYLLGGVSAGYWLVRRRTGADLRGLGSGATGATNAGRVLGTRGFVAVLACDAAKGAVAVLLARVAGLPEAGQFGAGLAAVAGHIWPVQLGFRGGRGLGPLLGAWLVLTPAAMLACLLLAGLVWALTHRRVPAGLFGALVLPLAAWFETRSAAGAALTAAVFAVVAFAHRGHLRPAAAATPGPAVPPPESAPAAPPPASSP
jgi:glycerol-3-phosphate acyltransferase PlsY